MSNRLSITLGATILTLGISGCDASEPLAPSSQVPVSSQIPVSLAHAPAAGFWYAFGEEPGGPSAIAHNGNEIEISLNVDLAPFSFHPKTVGGGGNFTIRNAAGDVISAGTWTATKLRSFRSYGATEVEPGVFLVGGSLQLHIELSTGEKGILRLTCTDFGNPPPGVGQGMTLQVVGGQHFTSVWVFPPAGPTQGFTFFVEN